MKESFWGVLVVVLGLFGIVVVNIFQNVTVDNDRLYYLIKESAEASAYDAIDLTYYRLNGNIKIIEDKFAENLTRRFAQNISNGNYKIIVYDVNELPPKISVSVQQQAIMNSIYNKNDLSVSEKNILNGVHGVIETKYKLDEVLNYLGITEDEWNTYTTATEIEVDPETGENVCTSPLIDRESIECIPGDIRFIGFEDINVGKDSCTTNLNNLERKAKYKTCNCGKWSDEQEEAIVATPSGSGSTRTYTWRFTKTANGKTIDEKASVTVTIGNCTTGLKITTPKDMDKVKPINNPNEPSTDNSAYIDCPAEGIKIPQNTEVTLHTRYIPATSTNRRLTWNTNNSNIVSLVASNPTAACQVNGSGTNCLSKALVTGKEIGTTTVTAKTTNGITASCKVEVWDGTIDTLSCKDISITAGDRKVIEIDYAPKNASKTDFTYTSSNPTVATITNGNTVQSLTQGTATITMTDPDTGKSTTCTVSVTNPSVTTSSSSGGTSGSGGNTEYWSAYYAVDPETGKKHYYSTEEKAKEAAQGFSQNYAEITGKKGVTSEVGHVDSYSGSQKLGDAYSLSNGNVASYRKTNGDFESIHKSNTTSSSTSGYIETIVFYDVIKEYNYNSATGKYELTVKYVETSRRDIDHTPPPPASTCSWYGNCGCECESPSEDPLDATCFIAGTQVQTESGLKNIEQIQIGDKVLSYNEKEEKTEYNEVIDKYVHENVSKELYEFILNGEVITATDNHPFYINTRYNPTFRLYDITKYDNTNTYYKPNYLNQYTYCIDKTNCYIQAKYLKVGDYLLSKDGNYYRIENIKHYPINQVVYNLEVKNNHNYYIGNNGYLVHNRFVK